MSKPILKHLCTCNGKGWVRLDDEWTFCIAGCEPPEIARPKERIVLPMLKAYNAARKAVA